MPASGLQTVFSITHSDHSMPHPEFHDITVIMMLGEAGKHFQILAEHIYYERKNL
jgi:hypothetical protein